MLIRCDMNPGVSLIFAFAAGMLAGMVTGLLHTKLGIPPILAGILTQIALYSINLNIMGQSNQAISVDKYSLAVSLRYVSGDTAAKIKVFTTCILFGVVIVAILYWYFGTEQGHAIRATGCNPQMARAQGINTSFCKVLALMISNGLVGLSGALYAQYQGAADVNMGRGAIVIGLAAVIIGDVLFGKLCAGKKLAFAYTLFSVIVGAIIYYLVLSIILWLKFPSDDLKLFSAIVVAIFLAIPYLKNKKKATRGRICHSDRWKRCRKIDNTECRSRCMAGRFRKNLYRRRGCDKVIRTSQGTISGTCVPGPDDRYSYHNVH